MKLLRYILLMGMALLPSTALGQQENKAWSATDTLADPSYKELSHSEWKKFKSFEKKLAVKPFDESSKGDLLRSYARDSIRILGVKLMAVKLLEERELLDRDIAENTRYYVALLGELKESTIPATAYLFLEEKVALFNQDLLVQKLELSKWLNIGLMVLCLTLVLFILKLKRKPRNSVNAALSKQEKTIRSLIVQGKTNKEIANELYISLSTVKSHITNIYAKLNVASRQELLQKGTGTST